MPMSRELLGASMVATSHARIEWISHGPQDMYLLYDQAHYHESFSPDGWWERTLVLDPYHWFRLSGTTDTSPFEAIQTILRQPDRPAFTLPALIVALFLAHSAHPDTLAHRQIFRWVTAAIPHLRRHLAPGSLQVGWNTAEGDVLEHRLSALITGLVQADPQVPWTLPDGAWFNILDQLIDHLWHFSPSAIQAISSVMAPTREDEESEELDHHPSQLDAVTALGYLSAIRFWREPRPTIRGLPIHTSMLEFLPLWHQALVIMDPSAPEITTAHFGWLCNGTLGAPSDGPFDHLIRAIEEHDTISSSAAEWQERIATLQQEISGGTHRLHGCWEVQKPRYWPVFLMGHVATLRIVAGSDGCWVRLIPPDESWGSVFWWRPAHRPPTCWSLALGEASTSLPLLALHTALWQMWRNLWVDGSPSPEAVRGA